MSFKSIAPIKALGQNFLIDRNIAAKTVELLNINPDDIILEIGPGTGALTSLLIEKKCLYYAVEIDNRAIEDLTKKFSAEKYPQFNLINSDIKKFDFNSLNAPSRLKIIGNIPYYLSSEIFFKLFESSGIIQSAVMTVQKEVAQRLTAKKGTKDYGILTLAMKMCGTCKMEFDVSPQCFYPAPNVWSTVIRMDFTALENPVSDYKAVMRIIREAFNQRRKMLGNSLKSHFSKIDINAFDNETSLRLKSLTSERPERLNVEDFEFLNNIFKNI